MINNSYAQAPRENPAMKGVKQEVAFNFIRYYQRGKFYLPLHLSLGSVGSRPLFQRKEFETHNFASGIHTLLIGHKISAALDDVDW